MSKFFIRRPIVAMVIAIIMVIVGAVAMVQLPTAQFPNIAPPEIMVQATYPGGRANTGASRCPTDRRTDQRRGQDALHVFAERE